MSVPSGLSQLTPFPPLIPILRGWRLEDMPDILLPCVIWSSFIITCPCWPLLLIYSPWLRLCSSWLVAPEDLGPQLAWSSHGSHLQRQQNSMELPCLTYPLDSCNMGNILAPFGDAWGSPWSHHSLTYHGTPSSYLYSFVLCCGAMGN